MKPVRYSPLHSFVHKVASSRPGARFFAPILHRLDAVALTLTRGRRTLSGLLAGVPTVVVTTTGARTGLPRTIPLLCIRDREDPEVFALIATNWGQNPHPAWYFNLKAHPQAECSIDGHSALYAAHEAAGEEYARFWNRAVDIYRGYLLYKQRIRGRAIPIMVMRPSAPQPAKLVP
jgi:deazaflavin-dependent oxidoreductase (nitroreductase family)